MLAFASDESSGICGLHPPTILSMSSKGQRKHDATHSGQLEWYRVRSDKMTATVGSDVVQSGRPIFDDFFQHLWPYIGNNTANVVFQMVKRLWLIRIDQ
ncbi:hypothetical protein TNCV_965681 [Trichonephila clavipes]|nr:hypothetical protein TNCV_965681 [Trichonephila clavipes]